MKRILYFAAIALALSGCGGGSGGGNSDGSTGSTTDLAIDGFTSKVSDIVAMTSDTSEAESVDAVTVTAPEDTQPMPLI